MDYVNGVQVYRPRYLTGPGTSLYALEPRAWWLGLAPVVEQIRRGFVFDLVHAHFIYPEGVVGARVAARYGIPLVISEHAPWEPWLRRLGVARQALRAARVSAAILPVSTEVRKTIVDYLPELGGAIDIIPPGVDGDAFPLGVGARRRCVLFVGFLNFNKGLDVLFEAMALLYKRGETARLLVVGGSHYRRTRVQEERIRRLPGKLGIADRVEFAGVLPQQRVAALMRESAVLVLPSRAESFGAVLVESLASGTPVVATRCGGPEDIVEPSVGRLVPPEDPHALADALADVLEKTRSFSPQVLRAHALQRFGMGAIVERIYHHYVSIVSRATT